MDSDSSGYYSSLSYFTHYDFAWSVLGNATSKQSQCEKYCSIFHQTCLWFSRNTSRTPIFYVQLENEW